MFCISVRPWEPLNNFHSLLKRRCFSPLKCVLFGFWLFSINELFSNQSISALLVYCQYVYVYIVFLQTVLYSKYSGIKRKGKQEGTSETNVYRIWETPLDFISLPQISLSPHTKDSQYLKRGTTQYAIRQTQEKPNQKLKKLNRMCHHQRQITRKRKIKI